MNTIEALNVLNVKNDVTKTELKAAYKKLSLKYHPDRNPIGLEMMKMVNEAYLFLSENLEYILRNTANSTAEDFYNFSEEMANVLEQVSQMEGVIYEMLGNWLWIYGDTKAYKDDFKKLNCLWASKKKCWYFRPNEHKCIGNRKERTFDEIRNNYKSNGAKYAGKVKLRNDKDNKLLDA